MLKTPALVVVVISLFSIPIFALPYYPLIYSFDSNNETWSANVGSDVANNPLFNWTLCYDLDKMLNYFRTGDNITSNNFSVSCASADADIKCGTNGLISSVASPSRLSRILSTDYTASYNRNCIGLNWTTTDATATGTRCGFTTNGTYYLEYSESGGGAWCSKGKITIKNNTYNPYFLLNKTSVPYSITIQKLIDVLGGVDKEYLFLEDMGYSFDTLSNAEWIYYYDNAITGQTAQLGTRYGAGQAFYKDDTIAEDNTLGTPCGGLTNYQLNNYNEINIPLGTYDIFCNNGTQYPNFNYWVLKIMNNTIYHLDVFFTGYSADYVSISDVTHTPLYPYPNMTVTVSWLTSAPANSSIIWRMKLLGNWTNGFSSWVMQDINDSVYSHSIDIDGSNILDGYQYQFYVKSGGSIDNNTNIFYNFTTASYILPISEVPAGLENQTAPVISDATKNIANALNIEQVIIVNVFAMIIIGICIIGAALVTHNPTFSIAVGVVGLVLFSLFGFLPYYVFVLIAIAAAFGAVKIVRGLFK
jgi:hypothetical protein